MAAPKPEPKSPPHPIDFEVLPPSRDGGSPDLSRLIAWLLDDLIRIPGTSIRVGLDPIIGLIPGLGDSSTAAISSMLLLQGMRAGVPRIVLARMALNVLINTIVGAIPGLGDLFSAFFKSNRRNYHLLQRHAGRSASRAATTGDWAFVIGLVAGLLLVALAVSLGAIFLAYQLLQLLFGAR